MRSVSKAWHISLDRLTLSPAEPLLRVPHAATLAWRVQPAQPLSDAYTLCKQSPGSGCTSAIPHSQHEQHLLVQLRALMRQRRGNALLGRRFCLTARLGARLVHLSKVFAWSAKSSM